SWASSAVTAAILLKAALIRAQAKAICFFIEYSPFLDLLDGGFERQGQPATVSTANRAVAAGTTVSQRLGLRPAIGIAQTELVPLRIRQLRPDRPRQCALVDATGRGRIAMNAVVDGHWH